MHTSSLAGMSDRHMNHPGEVRVYSDGVSDGNRFDLDKLNS